MRNSFRTAVTDSSLNDGDDESPETMVDEENDNDSAADAEFEGEGNLKMVLNVARRFGILFHA